MRVFGFLSAVVACVLLSTWDVRADPTPEARGSAVIVSSHIASHQDGIGAGVIVARIAHGVRILTAKHVVDFGPVTVWIDHTPYPAEIVRTFSHRDLAVVDALVPRVRAAALRPAIAGSAVATGQSVQIWGEDDAGPRLELGTIVASHAPLDDPEGAALIGFACADCRRGDSGAGLFGTDGRLMGILTARVHTLDDRTVMFVAEPIDSTVYATPSTDVATQGK